MSYLTTAEIKSAVKPVLGDAQNAGQDFFQTNPEPQFEDLLDTLEKRSRAIINGELKGEGYERETDRVDTVDAPDKPVIQLVYPVDTVSQVEVSVKPGDWRTLDTEIYSNDDQKLEIKQSFIERDYPFFSNRNPLTRESNKATWAKVAERVRITYDRGQTVDNIPQGIKEVQQEIIRRMLVHYRQEQNLANITPEEVQGFNQRQIKTDDIMTRIDTISQTKHKYLMLR